MQLAEAAELSHSFLSQLERGRANPSISSLHRIAHALGSSEIELLTIGVNDPQEPARSNSPVVVIESSEGARGTFGHGEARSLTEGDRPFQPLDVHGFNFELGERYAHPEDEFLYVIDGTMRIELNTSEVHVLHRGDALYYEGGTPHRWGAVDDAGYHIIVVKQRVEVAK